MMYRTNTWCIPPPVLTSKKKIIRPLAFPAQIETLEWDWMTIVAGFMFSHVVAKANVAAGAGIADAAAALHRVAYRHPRILKWIFALAPEVMEVYPGT